MWWIAAQKVKKLNPLILHLMKDTYFKQRPSPTKSLIGKLSSWSLKSLHCPFPYWRLPALIFLQDRVRFKIAFRNLQTVIYRYAAFLHGLTWTVNSLLSLIWEEAPSRANIQIGSKDIRNPSHQFSLNPWDYLHFPTGWSKWSIWGPELGTESHLDFNLISG